VWGRVVQGAVVQGGGTFGTSVIAGPAASVTTFFDLSLNSLTLSNLQQVSGTVSVTGTAAADTQLTLNSYAGASASAALTSDGVPIRILASTSLMGTLTCSQPANYTVTGTVLASNTLSIAAVSALLLRAGTITAPAGAALNLGSGVTVLPGVSVTGGGSATLSGVTLLTGSTVTTTTIGMLPFFPLPLR
jgi:hypothetical protein